MWNIKHAYQRCNSSIASRCQPTETSGRTTTHSSIHQSAMMWKQYPNNRMHRPHDMNHLMAVAKLAVESQLADSTLLSNSVQPKLPKFGHDEIKVGRILGKGGFCTVHEILNSKVILDDDDDDDDDADTTAATLMDTSTSQNVPGYDLYLLGSDSPHQQPLFTSSPGMNIEVSASERTNTGKEPVQDLAVLAGQYRRRGRRKGCRYALKRVTVNKTIEERTLYDAVVDLALEAKFLAVLRHPNIIKMRGTAVSCPFSPEDTYFIVLDRLYEIFGQRLLRWRHQKHSLVDKLMTCHHEKNRDVLFWVERLKVAHDIASALTYLHGQSIVYRDLKPDNIGFDVRGDVKIFDFGLAKEINPTQSDDNGTYKLTGATGSLPYMAPEVALSNPYNESADVYSFAILIWEILQLKTPFEGYTWQDFHDRVVRNGVRPKCDPEWPSVLLDLIRHGWSAKIRKRPTMSFFASAIRVQIRQGEQVVVPSVSELGNVRYQNERKSMHAFGGPTKPSSACPCVSTL